MEIELFCSPPQVAVANVWVNVGGKCTMHEGYTHCQVEVLLHVSRRLTRPHVEVSYCAGQQSVQAVFLAVDSGISVPLNLKRIKCFKTQENRLGSE